MALDGPRQAALGDDNPQDGGGAMAVFEPQAPSMAPPAERANAGQLPPMMSAAVVAVPFRGSAEPGLPAMLPSLRLPDIPRPPQTVLAQVRNVDVSIAHTVSIPRSAVPAPPNLPKAPASPAGPSAQRPRPSGVGQLEAWHFDVEQARERMNASKRSIPKPKKYVPKPKEVPRSPTGLVEINSSSSSGNHTRQGTPPAEAEAAPPPEVLTSITIEGVTYKVNAAGQAKVAGEGGADPGPPAEPAGAGAGQADVSPLREAAGDAEAGAGQADVSPLREAAGDAQADEVPAAGDADAPLAGAGAEEQRPETPAAAATEASLSMAAAVDAKASTEADGGSIFEEAEDRIPAPPEPELPAPPSRPATADTSAGVRVGSDGALPPPSEAPPVDRRPSTPLPGTVEETDPVEE